MVVFLRFSKINRSLSVSKMLPYHLNIVNFLLDNKALLIGKLRLAPYYILNCIAKSVVIKLQL